MSSENVKKFLEEVGKNEDLKNKLRKLMEKSREKADKIFMEKIVELGREKGFKCSKKDLYKAVEELHDELNENGEVLDEDLQKVAGGVSVNTGMKSAGMLITVIISAITKQDPKCKGWF